MDENQEKTLLRSISVSSGFGKQGEAHELQTAYRFLEEFKTYDGRVPICIKWLQQEHHVLDGVDITLPIKQYALTIMDNFLQKSYTKLNENERLAIRHAVLTAARQISPMNITNNYRILGNKLASILAAFVVREFPQRWTTFFSDIFSSVQEGGLWCNGKGDSMHILGVKICLECLRLVTEDTTDSDFNLKISTVRRSDVLLGLNEISKQLLPRIFGILEHYSYLLEKKITLHNMRSYLLSNGRVLSQMSTEEASMYQKEMDSSNAASILINDCLVTLSQFCRSMPIDWVFSKTSDFVTALLHLLREPTVHVNAIACLEQLALRKLDLEQWTLLIRCLPPAITEANNTLSSFADELKLEQQVKGNTDTVDTLTLQLPYHRGVSKMLSSVVSTNISHVSADKNIMKSKGKTFEEISVFLRLLVDLIHHPSGRISSDQINTWVILLRDPQLSKTKLLSPFAEELVSRYTDHLIRIRWDDIYEQRHPQSGLIEASWTDEEEYEAWIGEFRSRCTQLFRFLGNIEPQIVTSVLQTKIQILLGRHADGAPYDHLDPTNKQLTQKSEAVMQLEGLHQPLDAALSGVPPWALHDKCSNQELGTQIRPAVQKALLELANSIVSWQPKYLWLKFRRAQLLEALKHYWIYDTSTLLQGVDSLLGYLSAPDDWGVTGNGNLQLSGQIVSLRKKSGVSLVAVAKKVPHHLVPWLSQLSEAVRQHLSSETLLPTNRMHLFEFLSCVAAAVSEPLTRANFIAEVLADAISVLESIEFKQVVASPEAFLSWIGVIEAGSNPSSVTNPDHVKKTIKSFQRVFSALNTILSVGKRCHSAARKRSGGIPFSSNQASNASPGLNFPDEGPISLQDLSYHDPFVHLWPRIFPALIQIIDVVLQLWYPMRQAQFLQNNLQRYLFAISDDEAYLSKVHDSKAGGVFGEGGTAGSVIRGTDRRDLNLVPRWSGWLNELRNTCFQMLGLLSGQRALFAPELRDLYPKFVASVSNPDHLRAMENRHLTQYLKQFIDILLLSCPITLYKTHISPILRPLYEHLEYRLRKNWEPVLDTKLEVLARPLTTNDCNAAALLAGGGGENWFDPYYGRAGIFVGDLDQVTAEAVVEKSRVELSRTFTDSLQSALALKGGWALVLATIAKEESAAKKNDPSLLKKGPRSQVQNGSNVNADGSPKLANQSEIDARKLLRISKLCHFLMLEEENIAGFITLSLIQCLGFPDAYTVRRCTKICHRLLETVAWSPKYTNIIASRMFPSLVSNIVTEPKWMVGIEWDVINVIRDIYCRLVLGQVLQPGGQGPGMQAGMDPSNPHHFEQIKSADDPLKGGGILVSPSQLPRAVLASLPGIEGANIETLEENMKTKRSAKEQKDLLRDLLRVAAENSRFIDKSRGDNAVFGRAAVQESLLNQKVLPGDAVHELPEKLVTHSMIQKKEKMNALNQEEPVGLANFFLK